MIKEAFRGWCFEKTKTGYVSIYIYNENMSVAEIRQLPLRAKFQILEALWGDLSDRIDKVPVSDLEKELLDSRLAKIASGHAEILDWDDVKNSIGNR